VLINRRKLIAAVADGRDLDWTALFATAATAAERRFLENLHSIALIARFHRRLADAEAEQISLRQKATD
jgi:hypothetical protein